jgi:phosphoglucosamine mutase
MKKLFGTDGIRGIVNDDLTATLAFKIGASVAKTLKQELTKENLTLLVGTDTRISKDMITTSIISGVLSENCNIIDLGIMPTPAISYLTKKLQKDGAFIISASHNPSKYNGIKVLDQNGYKLTEQMEEKIEHQILNFKENNQINQCGKILKIKDPTELYINHLLKTIDINDKLKNKKILIDTANGASYKTAEQLFEKININYDIINNHPDGLNINKNAGSTHIKNLQKLVKENNYDLGIAYDGDADRCIMVDEDGEEVDGDYIIAICGNYLKKQNKLTNNTLTGTVMSNLGLVKFCKEQNINFSKTKVGDKYVLEEMLKNNYPLGGEQSGHIIFKEYANTGDGELTSLQILNVIAKENKSLKELKNIMKKYPQTTINLETTKQGKEQLNTNKNIQEKIKELNQTLKDDGRILVRPSGTENLIRIMVEGKDQNQITKQCEELANYINQQLNN